MGLVDYYRIEVLTDGFNRLGDITASVEVRVVQDHHVIPGATPNVGQVTIEICFPNRLSAGLWDDQGDTLALMYSKRSKTISPTNVLPRPTPSQRKAPLCSPAIFSSWP